ncbi:MAG: NAD(P)H-hydrate dehydratase, partial [Planctomycetes bacterium]|nr:NAD(P)H-hydrate dehydratase [Planctomycetota bacterium]
METVTEVPPVPTRPDDAHKGVVGRIVVLAGRLDDQAMIGAPALVANAALRSGVGLVQIV